MTSGDFASYLYKGFLITRIPPSEGGLHWNISKPNGEPFDARQTKADAKIAIDNWTAQPLTNR